jgi:hypothetical protein
MKGTLHEDVCTFMIISHSVLLTRRMGNVSDKCCRETRKTHFMFNNFFRKSCHLWDNIKFCRGGHGTDDNMAHAHCMLDT